MARDLKTHERARQLRSRIQKMDAELEMLEEEKKQAQRTYDQRKEQRDRLQKELDDLKQHEEMEPTVSDHGLLRYMERVMGFDLDGMRNQVLEGRRDQINFMVNGEIELPDGSRMVIKNKNVVTVK